MKILLALVMSAALAPAAYAHPARDLTEAGIRGAVVLSHRGVDAAGDVTTQTRFRVGSITKTFVATVTLQLVAEGRLSLDEPVPEAGGAPLRTLLNHTSGIYNHSDDPRVFEHGLLTRWKPEQLIAISREHPPYFPPGAAQWLVERGPKNIGFDFFEEYCARLPEFTSEDFAMHRVILGAGVVIMEGLTNLAALPRRRVEFAAPFYKIAGTEGAPARFFATV